MSKEYNFAGWATRNDIMCADGRTIKRNAFADDDGKIVPLVWNHIHNDPNDVIGHSVLSNKDDGVYSYGFFNDTTNGALSKTLVEHGDINSMSIFATNLVQDEHKNVLHGVIREVSLVHSGANPGAYIEDVLVHNEEDGECAMIYTGLTLSHAADDDDDDDDNENAQNKKEETVGDVFNTLSEKQKNVVYAMISVAMDMVKEELKGKKNSDNKEDDNMKHNVFETRGNSEDRLSHSDMKMIFSNAKKCGSLREAVENAIDSGILKHSIDTTGMETATGEQTYGFNDASMLFPDYKALNNVPEWISRKMDWVKSVMSGVHHTPFSRIKSVYANITEDEARAKGYLKAHQKVTEVFTTLKRTTDPQTIYKLQKLDRDDIIDITDFDVVAWIRSEMRIMLDEEIARAILIGDGRLPNADDKIKDTNVRPIATDVPLFNTKVPVTVAANADSSVTSKATINAAIKARKNYKGSGNPTFYTTEDVLTDMLLLEDGIGHKLYKSEAELATALRVKDIVTVEPMENQTISVSNVDYPLLGIIVNLADYNVGADKGGEVNMFDDFDIDYNQNKYLIETRISGALIKPYSALTLYLNKPSTTADDDGDEGQG